MKNNHELVKIEVLVFCLLIFVLNITAFGQGNGTQSIIQPSPKVEMFNRFLEYPVNTQTGIPEISIPLYEIICGDLKLPISISYHASGRKVYDENGPLGLGWVLNTGGMINRTVYGFRDDDVYPFPSPLPMAENLSVANDYDLLAGIIRSPEVNTWYDSEYDIFSYFLGGTAGNFILKNENNTKVPTTIPNRAIDIKFHKETNPNVFDYFEVLDENGIYYRFGKSIISGDNNIENTVNATTAWFISEIISANKQDTIHFKYSVTGEVRRSYQELIHLRDAHQIVQANIAPTIADKNDTEETSSTSYGSGRISEINFKKSKILFIIDAYSGLIDKMEISNNNELLKTIEFPKSILDSPVGLNVFDGSSAVNKKLDNILFKDKYGVQIKKYQFEYNPSSNFNVRESDWWGYYNNSGSINYRIPVFNNIQWIGTDQQPMYTSIGNATDYIRSPNLEAMKSGVLKSITYPTGGKTEFIYENNYYKEGISGNIKKCGGLRIAQKETTDNQGNTIVKTYKYGLSESGYGIINNEPSISLFGYEKTTVSFRSWMWCTPYPIYDIYRERFYFSDVLPQYSIYFNKPVMYPEVIEYNGEIANNQGKTLYKYETNKQYFAQLPGGTDYSISRKYVKVFDYWRQNQMTEKDVFDKDGNPVSKEIYNYMSYPKEEVRGIHLEQLYGYPQGSEQQECGATTCYHPVFTFDNYTVSTGIKQLQNTTQTIYFKTSDPINNQTDYTYNQNQLISKIEKTTNSGKEINKKYYPSDYMTTSIPLNTCESDRQNCIASATTYFNQMLAQCNQIQDPSVRATCTSAYTSNYNYSIAQCASTYYNCSSAVQYTDQQVITQMQDKHMISPVIEEQSLIVKNNVTSLTGGKIRKYKNKNGFILPAKEYELELNTSSPDLTVSSFNSSETMSFHTGYKEKLTYDDYDPTGNIVQFHLSDNLNTSFLWAYNSTMPVVKGENVAYDVLNAAVTTAGATNLEIFFSSFNNIATDAAQQTAWKNFNTALRSNTSLANSQVTTYTYSPLIGMTSQTDPNGLTTYYEYDGFGRLKNSKDKDQKILKHYEYHYYNQQ